MDKESSKVVIGFCALGCRLYCKQQGMLQTLMLLYAGNRWNLRLRQHSVVSIGLAVQPKRIGGAARCKLYISHSARLMLCEPCTVREAHFIMYIEKARMPIRNIDYKTITKTEAIACLRSVAYSMLKRFLKRSTRPPVSTSFCLPVKNG